MSFTDIRLTVLLILFFTVGLVRPKCLDNIQETPKRYVMHRGEEQVGLVIGQSERISHRLVSRLFYIFSKEVRRYNNVTLLPPTKETNLSTVASSFGHLMEVLPRNMVDLEVWVPAQHNVELKVFALVDCGSIAPPGRWGWFIPKRSLETTKNMTGGVLPYFDHWRVFKSHDTARHFALDKSKILKHRTTGANDGLYTPKWCEMKICALLLASDYETSKFVIKHIEKLQLYVEVVWVGDWLEEALRGGLPQPLVFLDFTPSERVLPRDERYFTVSFPPCAELRDEDDPQTSCKYDPHRLAKFAWSHLDKAARPAFESVQKMSLKMKDYFELLKEYSEMRERGASVEDAVDGSACAWLRAHRRSRGWWSADSKDVLYIGGIFPLNGNKFQADGIVLAATMAEEDVNFRSDILKDYSLNLLIDNGECKVDAVLKTFIDYIHDQYNQLVGILGPACSDTAEPLAAICKHFKTIIISYSAEGSSFSDRDKYPYFFRTIGENKQYKFVYLEILKALDWKRLGSLTEDGTKYTEYISHTQDLLQKNNINFIANMKFSQEWKQNTMTELLRQLKKRNVRIIIADVEDEAARAIMCAAYKLKMTATEGWVWFLPFWLSNDWYNTTKYNNTRGEPAYCKIDEMVKAINGYMILSHSLFAPNDSVMEDNQTVGEWRERYDQRTIHITKSNYAGFAYDAYWTYAYALDKLLKENDSYAYSLHSEKTIKRFVEIIQKTDFKGVSGRIHFGNGPSRNSINVDVMQWVNNNVTIVGTFYPNATEERSDYGGRLDLNLEKVTWLTPDSKKPFDGTEEVPKCLVQSVADLLNTDCEMAIIMVNILTFGLVGVTLIISFVIIKHRYDKKVQLTQKYMKTLGIDLLSPSTIEGLDKWEIPRDRVVINRKLGEGAFGTVYGGEAYFVEKGWVAVAVKTLKVGSTTEEKLDFLSEAEVMKRFDHKNIVRLLGVCTKNEPVYTVMEFMLYGDLKTYLLARRHLVNEKNAEENDEISNKKLTSMALDVARALSYLAQLKYVHRDVASRNCLVNASRTVKLGDFGMTRPMFENDFYKFSRKGMLPVRWMAPESLALGIFTPATDVWSFGVLLYEIITFGSFPFQGLSNNQVLEHVKKGNTIKIPTGVKPQLEGLIKACWQQDHKSRPQSSEIVEIIANNPRLLAACLDVPLSSVQIEDTGQLEIQLPAPRKFSLTLRSRNSSSLGLTTGWSDISAQPLLPPLPQNIALRDRNNIDDEDYHQDSIL